MARVFFTGKNGELNGPFLNLEGAMRLHSEGRELQLKVKVLFELLLNALSVS